MHETTCSAIDNDSPQRTKGTFLDAVLLLVEQHTYKYCIEAVRSASKPHTFMHSCATQGQRALNCG